MTGRLAGGGAGWLAGWLADSFVSPPQLRKALDRHGWHFAQTTPPTNPPSDPPTHPPRPPHPPIPTQLRLERDTGHALFVGLSLSDTLRTALRLGLAREAAALRRQFAVPEPRWATRGRARSATKPTARAPRAPRPQCDLPPAVAAHPSARPLAVASPGRTLQPPVEPRRPLSPRPAPPTPSWQWVKLRSLVEARDWEALDAWAAEKIKVGADLMRANGPCRGRAAPKHKQGW